MQTEAPQIQQQTSTPIKKPKKAFLSIKRLGFAALSLTGVIAFLSIKKHSKKALPHIEEGINNVKEDINNELNIDDNADKKVILKRGQKGFDENGEELMVVPKPKGRKKKVTSQENTKSATNTLSEKQVAEKAPTQKS